MCDNKVFFIFWIFNIFKMIILLQYNASSISIFGYFKQLFLVLTCPNITGVATETRLPTGTNFYNCYLQQHNRTNVWIRNTYNYIKTRVFIFFKLNKEKFINIQRCTSLSRRFRSPPNITDCARGISVMTLNACCSWRFLSVLKSAVLSRCEVIRVHSTPFTFACVTYANLFS